LVQLLKGDNSIVNGVAPHPSLPSIAICGIDPVAKVIEPSDDYTFDTEKANAVVERNTKGFSGTMEDEEDELTEDDVSILYIYQMIINCY
jgi:hypothetical protein